MPLPRFESHTLRLETEELPAAAIVALAEAKHSRLFKEFRLVTGTLGNSSRPRWGGRGRLAQRDPLLVGVIRTPDHWLSPPPGRDATWRTRVPGTEEHFLVAWWRPEDERDEVMF